jgi:beta-aspartyl-peptidase (threonine type)
MKLSKLLVFLAGVSLLLLPSRLGSTPPRSDEEAARGAIMAVLRQQAAAWNRGDLDGFMKGYWNSPDLTFAGSGGITRGWQPVLERYKKNYPDRQAMGHLDFSELELRPLGNEAALVVGRWHLERSSEQLGGVFTLLFESFPEGWRIIHDHTSREEKKS